MPGQERLAILVHDFGDYAFSAQLSRELACRGHRVLHAYCSTYAGGKSSTKMGSHDPKTLEFRAVGHSVFGERSWKRVRDEIVYGRLIADVVSEWCPDVVLSANSPLLAQAELCRRSHKAGAGFVYWQQDIISVAVARFLGRRIRLTGSVAGWLFGALERRVLRASDRVIPISSDWVSNLERWGVSLAAIDVVENWAPFDKRSVPARVNGWGRRNGLDQSRVLLYAGTLGVKHDPSVLLGLAVRLQEFADVRIVVVSEGAGADWLEECRQRDGLKNLVIVPFQPPEQLSEVYATADILLVILKEDAGAYSVPSKVLSYLCAGRPLLASMPAGNLASRILNQARAGVVVEPGDADAFADAAIDLLSDPARRSKFGANAREYASHCFDIRVIGDRFEHILYRATHRHPVCLDGPLSSPIKKRGAGLIPSSQSINSADLRR